MQGARQKIADLYPVGPGHSRHRGGAAKKGGHSDRMCRLEEEAHGKGVHEEVQQVLLPSGDEAQEDLEGKICRTGKNQERDQALEGQGKLLTNTCLRGLCRRRQAKQEKARGEEAKMQEER